MLSKSTEGEFYKRVERASQEMFQVLFEETEGMRSGTRGAVCCAAVWDLIRLLEDEFCSEDDGSVARAIRACFLDKEMFSDDTTH